MGCIGQAIYGRMMLDTDDTRHHIGLWTFANKFFRAGKYVMDAKHDSQDTVLYYLYCHSIELALKALLAYHGCSREDLKTKIRHDLRRAWKAALEKGLADYLTEVQQVRTVISVLSPYYNAKEFEYITTGYKSLSTIEDLYKTTARVIFGVGHAIKIPAPHLSQFHKQIILKINE